MIPMPPIHWMKARQKRIPRGMLSMPLARCGCRLTSPRIVAPVVVSPDMASKNASVKLGMAPERKKGREANRASVIQPSVTMANPSRMARV
ncbi:hypothetical protein ES703_117838 [subsurface metagenome]